MQTKYSRHGASPLLAEALSNSTVIAKESPLRRLGVETYPRLPRCDDLAPGACAAQDDDSHSAPAQCVCLCICLYPSLRACFCQCGACLVW